MKTLINDWDCTLQKWANDCATVYNPSLSSFGSPTIPQRPIDLHSFSKKIKVYPQNVKDTDLLYYEIPEPYSCQFNKEGAVDCNCVLINLNPGTSSPTEYLKYYFHANKKGMTLINDFCKNPVYSEWQTKFNYLNPTSTGQNLLSNDGLTVNDIPGYVWWHKTNRIPYLERLLKQQNKVATQQNVKPFIIEMCPFHSKAWSGGNNSSVYITQLTMVKKAVAISKKYGGLRFAVGIGKEISTFLGSNNGIMKLSVNQKSIVNKPYGINPANWPKTKNVISNRTYEVWEWNEMPILVTYSQGGNNAPAPVFESIEQDIITWMKNQNLI